MLQADDQQFRTVSLFDSSTFTFVFVPCTSTFMHARQFSLAQFCLFLSSMFLLIQRSSLATSPLPFIPFSALASSFLRFRKHDCTDSCCKCTTWNCTCHDFLVEYVRTRFTDTCTVGNVRGGAHTIPTESSMVGNSMDYAANF